MALKKKSILLIMAFLIGCFVCACGKEDSIVDESLVKDTELLFVFNRPSQSEISQVPYWSLSNSFCIKSSPISSMTCLKYHTQEVRKAS